MAPESRAQWHQDGYDDDDDDDDGDGADGAGSASSASSSSASPTRLTAPVGYAQFQGESDEEAGDDDSDEEELSESGDDDEGSEEDDPDLEEDQRREDALRKKMASVPFGALVKAQRSVKTASDEDISDIEEDEWATDRAKAAHRQSSKRVKGNQASAETHEEKRRQVKERLAAMRTASSSRGESDRDDDDGERQRREHRELQKRSSKHAPTEMSSRRPVSRKRAVIETQAKDVRDPRFSTLTGNEVDPELFRRSYSFLPDMQHQEISSLKQALSKLRKAETHQAGPKATSESALKIREERERVERALKRAEAKEAERQRRDREREVMKTFKKDNEERVSKGGKRFYLKDSAKRELMLQDKFSRLAGKKRDGADAAPVVEGTTSTSKALRKALDKRRRKNAAKERKTMPFLEAGRRGGTDGGASAGGPPMRRSPAGNIDTGGKRKR